MATGIQTGSRSGWFAVQWLTAGWAAALVCVCLKKNHFWFYDDAFITLRYARHLAEGLGPVWNRTGTPVEGFSSPLHLLLVTGLVCLGIDPVMAVRGLGFAFHAALIVFVWNYVRRSSGTEAGLMAAALVAASWPMLLWDLGGLDAVPFSALLTVGTLFTLRYLDSGARNDIERGGLLLGLALFMRPDGAVVAAIAFGACLLGGRRNTLRRSLDVLLGCVLCALMVLPWEIFRIRYFHTFLPNTYYAKIYGVPLAWRVHSGLFYWRVFITKAPYFMLLLPIVIGVMIFKRKATRLDVALWACIAGYGLYLLDCGGDHMLGFRFMTPIIPLMAVALVRGLAQLGMVRTPLLAAAVSVALLVVTGRQATTITVLNPGMRDTAGMVGEEVGKYIAVNWMPGAVVALNVAGGTPYYADDLTYIDMLGLNDEFIARRNPVPVNGPWVNLVGHIKGDGASVLRRRPDFIILGGPQGVLAGDGGLKFLGDYELIRLPGFVAQYKACQVPLTLSDFAYSQVKNYYPAQTIMFTYYQLRDLSQPCGNAR